MKYENWIIGTPSMEHAAALHAAGYPKLLSLLLSARGIGSSEHAAELLEREHRLTLSPMLMKDMDRAVARIDRAIAGHETVAVFGDYDVDGITSTVLLLDYLRSCGLKCLRYIPRRDESGYGLSTDAIAALRQQGASLMITVDCGVTGVEEVAFANSIGLDVVITDHHECKEELPDACAVVNPHRPDCQYPFKHLAGCGVALKLVLALGGECREDALFARYCTLAAVGTIADVMRMEGENRTIVSCGLDALPHSDFPGLHALIREVGLEGKPINSTQVGFVLSPRINAAGRMECADLAADLLECSDPALAEELARNLCALNRERQNVEQNTFTEAAAMVQTLPLEERSALVLSHDNWHQGVMGIVASRLSEKYACPTFMITLKDGIGKGSCRSWGDLNLYSVLENCGNLLLAFGGHSLAAGFTIEADKIPAFRSRVNRCVREMTGGKKPVSSLHIDLALPTPSLLNLVEAEELERLEPYGAGNLRPVFALLGATLDALFPVGQGRHLKLRLTKGNMHFDAIFFSTNEEQCGVRPGDRVDLAFLLQANSFRGVTSVQLQVQDIRPSHQPSHGQSEYLALLERLLSGDEITPQERCRLQATREQLIPYWRVLERMLSGGRLTMPRLPFLCELSRRAAYAGCCENFLRAALSVEVFRERGLIAVTVQDESISLCLNPVHGKVDLTACPYLKRLRDDRL